MRIHAICLTRNEADEIQSCLREACAWADRIYIYGGASTDGTWDKVQELRGERIVPWKSDDAVFREGLRAEVFEAFRSETKPGDWWCQLNADEFYLEKPRDFLERVPSLDHLVWAVNIQYYLTEKDLEAGGVTGNFNQDREKLRYYKAACAEPRFFRYRPRLTWNPSDAWPKRLGLIHPRPMHFRHYPYRSPEQIQMRLDVRRENRRRGFEGWDHAKEESWREKIVTAASLHHDNGGELIVEPEILAPLREPTPRRWIKQFMHGTGVWP